MHTTGIIALTMGLTIGTTGAVAAAAPRTIERCGTAKRAVELRLAACQRRCDHRANARPAVDVDACRQRCAGRFETASDRLLKKGCPARSSVELQPEFIPGELLASSSIKTLDGRCLDVRNGNSTNRTPIQLYTCNSTAAQGWAVRPNAITGLADKCLDMPYAVTGGGVWLFDCWGGWNQQWTLYGTIATSSSIGRGWYEFATTSSSMGAQVFVISYGNPQKLSYTASGEIRLGDGRCLMPWWAGGVDGTPIIATSCSGAAYQKWSLGPGRWGIRSYTGKCLRNVGGALQLATCNEYDSYQRFTFQGQIKGWYNMCLTYPPNAPDWTPASVAPCSSPGTNGRNHWRIGF